MPEARPPLSYLPQLDALRAFAVGLVMWHHWVGPPELPLGPIGVWIFLVLSGFLITRILLGARSDDPHENRRALANFYVRRILRIFPLYYFVLLLALWFSPAFRADWYWYVTSLQNFRMVWADDADAMFGVHLWTLAVEQQFYFVWPLFMLFLPRFALLPAIALAIASAIASRAACAAMGWTPFQIYAFTPSNLDTLGLGALLAYFVTHLPDKVVSLRRVALAAAVVIMAMTWLVRTPILGIALMQLPTGLIALWFIAHTTSGFPGVISRLLSFPPSVYLGRISYGLYVYHFFMPDLVRPLLPLHIEDHSVAFILACFVMTVAVASLSWFLLENPVRSLKNRFRMPARSPGR